MSATRGERSGADVPRGEVAVFASGRVIVRESDQHRLYVVEVLAADGSVLGVSMIDVDADGEDL